MAVVFKMVSAAETGFIEDRNSAMLQVADPNCLLRLLEDNQTQNNLLEQSRYYKLL